VVLEVDTKAQEVAVMVDIKADPLKKCIKLFVEIVEMNVKFHLNHQVTDQFTAETVLENINNSKFIFLNRF
jgi:hypothetical protein